MIGYGGVEEAANVALGQAAHHGRRCAVHVVGVPIGLPRDARAAVRPDGESHEACLGIQCSRPIVLPFDHPQSHAGQRPSQSLPVCHQVGGSGMSVRCGEERPVAHDAGQLYSPIPPADALLDIRSIGLSGGSFYGVQWPL